MDKTRETKISLYVTLVLFAIVVIFMFVASFITSVGYNSYQTALIYNTAEAFEQTTAQKDRFTIVLDAGHGGEDPGAVANGAVEKDINLSIAKKLKDFLELTGVNVVLTRDKDVLLYTQEQAKSNILSKRFGGSMEGYTYYFTYQLKRTKRRLMILKSSVRIGIVYIQKRELLIYVIGGKKLKTM